LSTKFSVPDYRRWEIGYAKVVKMSILPIAHTLEEALTIVKPLADPLLDGTANGHWGSEVSMLRLQRHYTDLKQSMKALLDT
jgi:hypothetical protein